MAAKSTMLSCSCFLPRLTALLLLSLQIAPLSSAAELCNPQDKKVLLQIKKEFGNPTFLSSWNETSDCCNGNWEGVACDTDNKTYRINYFSLSSFDLPEPTPIPPSIGNLPYLNFLFLYRIPNLVGNIPPSISDLTNLHYITISFTNISGEIPSSLSRIKTLVTIDFSYNSLSGGIPASLSSLPNLVGIVLDGNRLSGEIPASLGSLSSKLFTSLTLSQNRLSGKIPATLGRLNLSFVDLSRNMLEGDASMLFGVEKNTDKIILARNAFSFDIGKVPGFSKNLATLDLRNNQIYGKLPQELTELKHLHKLNVSFNNLCGEIPSGGNFPRFDASSYVHNKCLCGSPLPSCKTN